MPYAIMSDKQVCVFSEEGFQLPVPCQSWDRRENVNILTHKQLEMPCILSIVATDALVLKHHANRTHGVDQIFSVMDLFHSEMLLLFLTKLYLNKNTLETCKNPRPTSGWIELTKSCTTSTMNFHMAYFSRIPQNNAKFKLSCKFGESKCNPC